MIRECTQEDIVKITNLVFELNNRPEHYCAYCCKESDSIENDFMQLITNENHRVLGEFDGNMLTGVMGFFVDDEKTTADCVGPFVKGGDFMKSAFSMFLFAKRLIQKPLRYNFFFDRRNYECLKLMGFIGAVNKGNECILNLKRKKYHGGTYDADIIPLPMEYADRLIALHDSVFPNVYLSGRELIDSLDDYNQIFCAMKNDSMVGYSMLKVDPKSTVASAEFLAVGKIYRGQGYGRALLDALVSHAVGYDFVNSVDLVVENSNKIALKLYSSFGFELKVENCYYAAV